MTEECSSAIGISRNPCLINKRDSTVEDSRVLEDMEDMVLGKVLDSMVLEDMV
jgi:hypothetical protein